MKVTRNSCDIVYSPDKYRETEGSKVLNKNSIIYDACFPAWKTASEESAKNGVPYGIHITTTPNNTDTASGKYCKQFIDLACPFRFEFYDMEEAEIKKFIDQNYKKPFVFIQFTWKEIGRTDAWYQEMRRGMSDYRKFKREVDLVWTKSSDNGLFGESQMEKIEPYIKKSVYDLIIDNRHIVSFYEKPDLRERYIFSCDVSGGTENDNSVITIIAPDNFRVVGDFSNAKIDTHDFKNLIKTLVKDYFVNSLLVIEANSFGKNILDDLNKDNKIEPRIYKEERQKIAEKTMENGLNVKSKKQKLCYGVDTTSKSRKLMFDLLPSIVDDEYENIVSPRLYDDIKNLIKLPNGRVEAEPGHHDDSLMSYLIFRYAVYYGGNFFKQYGINSIPSERYDSTRSGSNSALKTTLRIKNLEARDFARTNTNKIVLGGRDINSSEYIERVEESKSTEKPKSKLISDIIKWNS